MINPMIAPSQLRTALHRPEGILNFIETNNPEAVADNLEALGFNRANSIEILDRQLGTLLAQRKWDQFVQACNVPLLTNSFSPEQLQVIAQTSREYTGAEGGNFLKGQGHIDFQDIMRGLATGYLTMIDTGTDDDDAGDTGGGNGAGSNGKPDPKKDDRTKLIIGLVIGAVALVLVALGIRWMIKRSNG